VAYFFALLLFKQGMMKQSNKRPIKAAAPMAIPAIRPGCVHKVSQEKQNAKKWAHAEPLICAAIGQTVSPAKHLEKQRTRPAHCTGLHRILKTTSPRREIQTHDNIAGKLEQELLMLLLKGSIIRSGSF
jgi:hypothetical protein